MDFGTAVFYRRNTLTGSESNQERDFIYLHTEDQELDRTRP
jgi:hypothetical protein